MPLVALIFPVPVKLYKGVYISNFANTHLFKCSLQLKRQFPSQNSFFPNFLVGMCMLAVAVYVGCTVVCLYSQGGDPAQGSRECRRLNSHTNTLSKIHFHPAEWVPMSNGAHSGHPSLVPSQISTVCALRLPCPEKKNDVMGNAQESLFKSTLLFPAKIPVELRFSNWGRGLVIPRVVLRHLEKSISQQWWTAASLLCWAGTQGL